MLRNREMSVVVVVRSIEHTAKLFSVFGKSIFRIGSGLTGIQIRCKSGLTIESIVRTWPCTVASKRPNYVKKQKNKNNNYLVGPRARHSSLDTFLTDLIRGNRSLCKCIHRLGLAAENLGNNILSCLRIGVFISEKDW